MKNAELIELIRGLESYPKAAKILVRLPDNTLKPAERISVMSDEEHKEDWIVFEI